MEQEPNEYSNKALVPLLILMGVAAAAAMFSLLISSSSVITHAAVKLLQWLFWLVPSVSRISGQMHQGEVAKVMLMLQWLFGPAYLWALFFYFAPWSPRMRRAVIVKASSLTSAQRFAVPIFLGILVLWLLGDFGVLSIPTFYNGRFLYPQANAPLFFKFIASSSFALMLYAWFSPLFEAFVVWMLCFLAFNAKIYLASEQNAMPE